MPERRDKAEASAPRKRALVSCDRCKLRRARCIRDSPDEPCADCKLSGVQCESKLPRKQRVYGSVETLSLRYRALESLVKGLFPQENIQDTNTIFQLAAARDIPMPASDDYTPADIFNDNRPLPSAARHQQHQDALQSATQTQQPCPSAQKIHQAVHSAGTSPPGSTSRDSQHNPFSEVQQPLRPNEDLIPTRHGAPHYFGPSSSFRLAMTIRTLAVRWKAAHGTDIPASRGSNSNLSLPAAFHQTTSTNPSDEEYTIPTLDGSQSPFRGRRKRSRSQMEGTSSQWEERGDGTRSNTIGDLLPSRSLADALVSAYFDNIHIYLPLFHRSMFQMRLEATYSRHAELLKDTPDTGWLICLALVFSFGCQQLCSHDPEQAHTLRLKYLAFAKTFFRKLLTTTSLVNVQALVLLNLHHHAIGQKSSSWLLIGLGARMAITMGMHRDGPNSEFNPIERNTRRQVWWSIYTFEKILCSILGRPTVIDEREVSVRVPDTNMLEQSSMSAEYMKCVFDVIQMSYRIRQRAYIDARTAEERSPTHETAVTLLRECDAYFLTIPRHLCVDFAPPLPGQRARILLLHVYYYYTRCIVSRDFLIQKVERNISRLENRSSPIPNTWESTLALSEDCVESAHQSLRCIMAGADLGIMEYSWLDLFFVFHSVLIVCADFLARPRDHAHSRKDTERKATVGAMLAHVRSMKALAPTYFILGRIAMQFARMTGVYDESGHMLDPSLELHAASADDSVTSDIVQISDVQEDCFASATSTLGLDFFDLNQNVGEGGYFNPGTSEPDDWTTATLKGVHTI
ncbi:fungal-specific transcription factor domain-containing protein [Phaeosphaeriaceae sp. PMI808]|nr:fungal-specific transcription factor domain-containing protein [Phaeosphaeriaceae sp. PMI808]